MQDMKLNVPTILTLIRLLLSPFVLPALIVYTKPPEFFIFNVFLVVVFLLLSLTDFLDGYLARKYGQETTFGSMIDPVADKMLISSVLIALLAAGKIFFYWVVILIGREFFVMGLRYLALEQGVNLTVSWWGKVKTGTQVVFLAFALLNPYGLHFVSGHWHWSVIQALLLLGTLITSLGSAYHYYELYALQCLPKELLTDQERQRDDEDA